MSVALTPELQQIVDQRRARGSYDSDEDVLRQALELLEARDAERERRIAALDERVQAAMESSRRGEARELDVDALLARARERAAR